jgi:UDP-N-acetylmuramate--alanine ligase
MATAIAQHHPATHYGGSHEDISAYLKQFLRSGDLVIFLGAGDINKQIPPLLAHFQQLEQAVIAEVALR